MQQLDKIIEINSQLPVADSPQLHLTDEANPSPTQTDASTTLQEPEASPTQSNNSSHPDGLSNIQGTDLYHAYKILQKPLPYNL